MNLFIWSTILGMLWAMQAWALVLKALKLWGGPLLPPPWVLPNAVFWVRPERETMLYVVFILLFGAGTAAARQWLRAQVRRNRPVVEMYVYAAAEAVLVFLLAAAYFQTIVYDYRAALAENAFTAVLVGCVLLKVFYRKLWTWGVQAFVLMDNPAYALWLRRSGDAAMLILLAALVYIPDYEAALARVFIGEQCCHIDHFIMAPGWAHVNGLKPYIDVLSEYGTGIPAVITFVARLFGPFSYDSIFQAIMWMTLVYVVGYYVFLRVYFKHLLLSIAAILLGIKFILFYTMSYPLILTYPSSTPLRCWMDVLLFLLLLGHMRKGQAAFLLGAGVMSGISTFYMTTNGLCQIVALYAYLFLLAVRPAERRRFFSGVPGVLLAAGTVLLPMAAWLGATFLLMGKDAWSPVFWQNIRDLMAFSASSLISGPYWTGLLTKQLIDVAIGCFIPALYVFTILAVGTRYFLGLCRRDDLMVIVMAVYGLGAFHHHVSMSMANNYYTMGLCYVFVLAYWVNVGIAAWPGSRRRAAGLVLVAVCGYALFTNHHYISYPNVFNFSRNPMVDQTVAEPLPDRMPYFHHKFRRYTEEDKVPLNDEGGTDEKLYSEADFPDDQTLKDYYHVEYDFSKDAQLIAQYTRPDERVALISSFEVKMLMQAKRKPLFYYFLLVDSRPMHMRHFGIANLFTDDHLKKTISQIAQSPSPYVFMERKYLQRRVPKKYYDELFGLMDILDYVNTHYEVVDQGQYLVAMKRKQGS